MSQGLGAAVGGEAKSLFRGTGNISTRASEIRQHRNIGVYDRVWSLPSSKIILSKLCSHCVGEAVSLSTRGKGNLGRKMR